MRGNHIVPRLLCLLVACWALGLPAGLAAADARKLNVLWITVEDMSPRLGCYGDRTVPTPNVDRLAQQGVRFTRAFGVYGVCAPNRHTLILGMYPHSTGGMAMRTWKRTAALEQITDPKLLAIPTYEATPPPAARCFTEYLRAAGYYCTNNAKTDYQFRTPVTAWDESGKQAHWRNRPAKTTPFFAVFNLTVTHESGIFRQRSPRVTDPSAVTLPPYYPDSEVLRGDLARHYDNIAAMDRKVGQLLKELAEDGLLNETVVFFFSDHGDGLPRMKRWVYDSGIHVPLIIRWPDADRGGEVSGQLVSFVDFAPAMLSLLGLQIPEHMQGRAFLGSQKGPERSYVFASRDRMDPAPETIRAVRDKRFKYVRNYRPDLPYIGFIPYRDRSAGMQELLRLIKDDRLGESQWQFTAIRKPLEELYDTQTDPHEIRNLAADSKYYPKLAELRAAHTRWTQRVKDLGHLPEVDLVRKLWPPLGVQPTTAAPRMTIVRQGDSDVRVALESSTPGASIAFRLSRHTRWHLYSESVVVPLGSTIWTRAHRLGWKPSSVVKQNVP